MAKAKGTKGSAGGKSKAAAKPRAAAPAKAQRSAQPAAKTTKIARTPGAARVATTSGSATPPKPVAAKAPVVAKAPVAKPAALVPAAPEPAPAAAVPGVAGAPGVPGADTGLRTKKKVKRGAPPMLPRRLTRRPMPAAPGTEGSSPPAPPKATVPGSLHAPARVPEGAEGLKARLMAVMGDLARLRSLKRSLNKQFWDAGTILAHLSNPELYQAKGYGSWEAFLEREVERELAIGRTLAVDLVRIVKVFQREPAEDLGLERLRNAIKALWPEPGAAAPAAQTPPAGGGTQAPWDPEGGAS